MEPLHFWFAARRIIADRLLAAETAGGPVTSPPSSGIELRHRAALRNPLVFLNAAVSAKGRYSLLAGLGIVIVGSLLIEISRLNTWDEAWFLQAATRLSRGEALYREVFFPTTPLAAYAGSGVVALFGSELVVLKVAGVACIAATFLLVFRVAEQLRTPFSPVVLGAAVLLVELPYTFGYTIAATMLLVATLAALLAWHARFAAGRSSRLRWLVLTGALAGATMATKHNVGVLVGAASAISVVVILQQTGRASARESLASLAAVTVPMAIVPLAVMVPVLLSGGLHAAFDYTVASKFGYLEHSAMSYGTGFGYSLGALLPDERFSAGTVLAGLQAGRPWVYLLPPAAALAVGWAWWRRREAFRGNGIPLVSFTMAAAATIYPLAEQSHLTVTAPLFLVAVAHFARATVPRAAGSLLGLGCVALAGVLMVTAPLLWARWGNRVATTAHVRGVVMAPGAERQLIDSAHQIRAATGGRAVFYLLPEAGLYYLLTDSANPTPYDFPMRTAFGTEGTRVVREMLDRGEIQDVCLDRSWGLPGPLPGPFPALQPVELATHIRTDLTYVITLAACDLYTTGRGGSAN